MMMAARARPETDSFLRETVVYGVATRRQFFSLQNMRSMTFRRL